MLFRCSTNSTFDEKGLHSLPFMVTMTGSKWDSTKYLYQHNVLQFPVLCPACGSGIGYKKDPYASDFAFKRGQCDKGPSDFKACFTYRCKKRTCSLQQSVFSGTFFEKQKKPVNEILMCLFLWLSVSPPAMTMTLLGWGEKTVLQYFRLFRQMVSAYMVDFIAQDISEDIFTYDKVQIGGAGIEVQIDESAFGKRKYNRGHGVDTKWVFGGVEIVPDAYMKKTGGRFFAVVVPDWRPSWLSYVLGSGVSKIFALDVCSVFGGCFSEVLLRYERLPFASQLGWLGLMRHDARHRSNTVASEFTQTRVTSCGLAFPSGAARQTALEWVTRIVLFRRNV